jgi:CubicO group peptidase (beta-lactamase class C family)
MDHAPGTTFLYSNIGYAILGATLGMTAGVPFVQWQQQHVLEPLGMRHTAFEIEPAIAPDVTRGYDIDNNGRADPAQSIRESMTGRGYKVPNGALYTTVDDLSRFLVLQLGHGPASVVAPARLDSAFNAVLGPDRKPTTPYGIGFGVERKGDHNFYGHNGGVAGFTALLEFDRDRQVGVIVLRSATGGRGNGPELGVRVLQLLADAPQ